MNDQLQATVADILTSLQTAAETYGPQALEVAASFKRIEGLSALIPAALALTTLIALIVWWRRRLGARTALSEGDQKRMDYLRREGFMRRSTSEDREYDLLRGIELGMEGMFSWLMGSSIAAAVVLLFNVNPLLNIWNWVAVFNPKLALAHDIYLKLTGGN